MILKSISIVMFVASIVIVGCGGKKSPPKIAPQKQYSKPQTSPTPAQMQAVKDDSGKNEIEYQKVVSRRAELDSATRDLSSANAFACGAAVTLTSTTVSNSPVKAGSMSGHRPPSTVKLKMVYDHGEFSESEHCGATVIDNRWLVTAAHCLQGPEGDDSKWDRIEVTAGDESLDGPNVISRVATDAVCHAGFDYGYLSNDIALIRLDSPLPTKIRPLTLDDYRRPSVSVGGIARAAGWPVTGPKAGTADLQQIILKIDKVEWPGYITASSPTGKLEGLCKGESGGPIVGISGGERQLAGVLAGIELKTENDKGEPCTSKPGYEMYFTPIAAYRNWIDEVVAICNNNPNACRGTDSAEFFMSQANTK